MTSSMVAWFLRLAILAGLALVEIRQVSAEGPVRGQSEATESEGSPGVEFAAVVAGHVAVYDRPDETGFGTGMLERGDRVRVRRRLAGGWVAIDPPPTAIGWMERASLGLGDATDERGGERFDAAEPGSGLPVRAAVVVPRAIVRSGQLGARMPGPPWIELPRETMVRLVDRPLLRMGRGAGATLWCAVVPPAEASCFVRASGLEDARRRAGVSEILAAYLVPEGDATNRAAVAQESLPPGVAGEIGRVDAIHRAILTGQPIEQWRFEAVRADYQAILQRSGDNPTVEETLRVRLARVTRHEQAAAAAREFQEVLARSRRRDARLAQLRQQLAAVDRYHSAAYHAIGYVQPSSRLLDGRKLHALVGPDGKTVAYLDIPPALDVESLGAHRVGVRGTVHYNQDLGTRLITVRDLEPVGARR